MIGAGDKLRLNIYGEESFRDKEMRVVGDGNIAVPYVGDMRVAGMTVTEAADDLTRRLSAGFLVDPKVSVEIIEYRSQWVNVSGQVEKPGRYYLEGPTRLVDLIARAGGLKKEAGTTIRLTRSGSAPGGDEVFTFSRQSLYLTDDPDSNPLLRTGDTIAISSETYFFIKGEVKSPGRYALDHNTTILKAISLAGGFEQYANQKKIELLRQEGEETIRLVINVDRIEHRKAEDVPLLPGDIINVRARFL
jgi:polysaccharide export outer membrane protein